MSHPHPELGTPPPLPDGALRVVALGGLGEVGRNMAVLEYAGRLLVIDCGVLFPEEHQPGVDLILPDFEYIKDRLDDIEAIILTHGQMIRRPPRSTLFPYTSSDLGGRRIIRSEAPVTISSRMPSSACKKQVLVGV